MIIERPTHKPFDKLRVTTHGSFSTYLHSHQYKEISEWQFTTKIHQKKSNVGLSNNGGVQRSAVTLSLSKGRRAVAVTQNAAEERDLRAVAVTLSLSKGHCAVGLRALDNLVHKL